MIGCEWPVWEKIALIEARTAEGRQGRQVRLDNRKGGGSDPADSAASTSYWLAAPARPVAMPSSPYLPLQHADLISYHNIARRHNSEDLDLKHHRRGSVKTRIHISRMRGSRFSQRFSVLCAVVWSDTSVSENHDHTPFDRHLTNASASTVGFTLKMETA
jgi:hypothetical protein